MPKLPKLFSLSVKELMGKWSLWIDDPAADALFKGVLQFQENGKFELHGVNSLEHSTKIAHIKEHGTFKVQGEHFSFEGSVWLQGTWLAELTPSKAIVLHSVVNGKPYHY